jgi:ATP-dependent DNA helicase DinG
LNELQNILGPDGPFGKQVSGYRFRPGQIELAQAIQETIEKRGALVAEAGTGTGKTWAYLVPAILSAGKVMISTGTRTLQDQLFAKDLPIVRDALGVSLVAALLKGRGNYVCLHHLERLQTDPEALRSRNEVVWLRQIRQFAASSQTGDRAELLTVPEQADLWNRVTSTRENCLGQECPSVRDCFVYKARRQAQDADLVVINHALFMADAALREEGISDLLPEADVVIFDEAHQLPAVATRFLGKSVSTGQVLELARQAEVIGLAHAREAVKWTELGSALTHACRELRLALSWVEQTSNRRATPDDVITHAESPPAFELLSSGLTALIEALGANEERHPDLAALFRTSQSYLERVRAWQLALNGSFEVSGEGLVYWLETTAQQVRLNVAPLSVAQAFSREKQGLQAWVFVSATLSVKGDFGHFTERLGLNAARTAQYPSPFDYAEQAYLCVSKSLPAPNHPEYSMAFADWLFPVIVLNEGAALVLCTTLRAVERVADALQSLYEAKGLDWPILRQGGQPRGALLAEFRERERAVLVGSASFWEGVDVAGDRLTVVAIDKLPFAPPDDPILEARLAHCRESGGNPFIELQIPEAAIALKQGAGRLIRSEQDWGVLLVGDSRLVDKPYGRTLWQGLPPFQRTREIKDVLAFIEKKKGLIA